ncbi:hypothetical protein DFH06DRAFT_1143989 [Mycena polygramma]|nr:hypothetical protein DFH06DRAFT_1143989 [Mycena polygramma]
MAASCWYGGKERGGRRQAKRGRGEEPTSSPELSGAVFALGALRRIKLSRALAGADLWPRIWQWIYFLHTYHDNIHSSHLLHDVSEDLLFFVACLSRDADIAAMMSQTPGVRTILIQSWTALFEMSSVASQDRFVWLSAILRNFMEAYEPESLAEILDATDGPSGLASLIVKYIEHFIPTGGGSIAEKTFFFYDGVITFTTKMLEWAEAQKSRDIGVDLVSAGIVKPLTAVICAMGESPAVHKVTDDTWMDTCSRAPGRPRASLTRSPLGFFAGGIIRRCVIRNDPENDDSAALWNLVTSEGLPSATVFRTVLLQLEPQLTEIAGVASSLEFQRSAMYPNWLYFNNLALQRIGMMNALRDDCHSSRRACDNMECGSIREKANFRRCSHCRGAYYCSPDCQERDWRSGHRDTCNSLRSSKLRNPDISSRNVAFMRKLFHRDSYLLELPGELCARLQLMRAHPGEPLVSVLDYRNIIDSCGSDLEITTRAPVREWVMTLAMARNWDSAGDICWDEYVSRAARSGAWRKCRACRALPRHCRGVDAAWYFAVIQSLSDRHKFQFWVRVTGAATPRQFSALPRQCAAVPRQCASAPRHLTCTKNLEWHCLGALRVILMLLLTRDIENCPCKWTGRTTVEPVNLVKHRTSNLVSPSSDPDSRGAASILSTMLNHAQRQVSMMGPGKCLDLGVASMITGFIVSDNNERANHRAAPPRQKIPLQQHSILTCQCLCGRRKWYTVDAAEWELLRLRVPLGCIYEILPGVQILNAGVGMDVEPKGSLDKCCVNPRCPQPFQPPLERVHLKTRDKHGPAASYQMVEGTPGDIQSQ